MNFSKGFEEELWGMTLRHAERVAERFAGRCESPIETSFAVAFVTIIESNGQRCAIPAPGTSSFGQFAGIAPQFQIDSFRVDFLVGLKNFARRAVVECDGREYHHATRDQIERDRIRDRVIEGSHGLKVFRFPGTQIHNQPFDCAQQVILWLIDGPKQQPKEDTNGEN